MTNWSDILDDPAVSYWLKSALKSALERDPVDALNDAEILADALREHMDDILKARATGGISGQLR